MDLFHTYSINGSCRQVSRGCLARLKRFGWLVALTICNVAAVAPVLKSSVIIRLSGLMNARLTPVRPLHPCPFVAAAALGSSLVLADAAGSFSWLPWAQFVSPSILIWNLGLAYEAAWWCYINQTFFSTGLCFDDGLRSWVWTSLFGQNFGCGGLRRVGFVRLGLDRY